MAVLSFEPKQVTDRLLDPLKGRATDVLINRFGLGKDATQKTLEEIGKKYGITRERVRQIESAALASIRKSEQYQLEQELFQELRDVIHRLGAVIAERELLESLADDEVTQNHVQFHLHLSDHFTKHKENNHFEARWSVHDQIAEDVHTALQSLYKSLNKDHILSESEIIKELTKHTQTAHTQYEEDEVIRRWLNLSKRIAKNPLEEWGRADSSNIKIRGVRDYAFLVMRKHGSPMHFREVAKAITETFGRKSHAATTHNELIKDSRFVLVGRGMYGLKEWGYKPGVVRDVIRDILEKKGPMTKEEIIDSVLKERYLKRNTILVNLQNPKYFKKTKDGRYTTA